MAVDLSILVRRMEALPDDHPEKNALVTAINPRFYVGKYPEHKEAADFVQSLPHGGGNNTVIRALLVYKELMRALSAGEIHLDSEGKLQFPQNQLELGETDIQALVAAEVQRQLGKA